ncbi:MAG TPA: hypothetical protein VE843_17110 [Ktedonobacteraceae bacterium]|nr:hypothetical protein [Ktedonobacteraceae bacterium]
MTTTGQNGASNSGALGKVIIAAHWGAILALIAIGVLYAFLPSKVNGGPAWLLLTIEGVILLPLVISILTRHRISLATRRFGSLVLLGVVTLALSVAIVHLIFTLKKDLNGAMLLYTGLLLYLCNTLVFSLWYWAVDGGGADKRLLSNHQAADFLFPQQMGGFDRIWMPHYFDYLYVAFTGATAFSPTDTMPLSHRAKFLMMAEAMLALLLISFVVSRAINII